MERIYENPEMEVIVFEYEDVITSSRDIPLTEVEFDSFDGQNMGM